MLPITKAPLGASFVGPITALDFDGLDFLGWRSPDRAGPITRTDDRWAGILLRAARMSARSLTRTHGGHPRYPVGRRDRRDARDYRTVRARRIAWAQGRPV